MGRLTNDMARLRREIDNDHNSRREGIRSRASSVSAQLANFKLIRVTNGSLEASDRAAFVAGNNNSVNRLIKGFHASRVAMGQQDRMDRAAFVSGLAKQTADMLTQFGADHKRMTKHTASVRASFIVENAASVATLINEFAQDRANAHAEFFSASVKKKSIRNLATPRFDEVSTANVAVSEPQFEPTIGVEVVQSESHTGISDVFKVAANGLLHSIEKSKPKKR